MPQTSAPSVGDEWHGGSTQLDSMRGRLIGWAFGLAPVVTFVSTWSYQDSDLKDLIRMLALPVLALEVGIFSLALAERFRLKPRPWPVWASLGGAIAVAWFAAANADVSAASLLRTSFWMVHLLFGLAAYHLATTGILRPSDIVRPVQVGFFAVVVLFVVFAMQAPAHFNWKSELPAFSNIRWFGFYAAMAIGLSVFQWRSWPLAAIAFAVVFWTGSRGALAATVIGPAVAACFLPAFRDRGLWARLSAALIVGLIVSLVLDAGVPIQGADRMAAAKGTNLRWEIWVATVRHIAERPWFGWGEAQIAYMDLGAYKAVQPHNVILQVLHAWGIIGAALLIAPAYYLAKITLAGANQANSPLVACVFILAAFAMVDSTLYQIFPLAVFAMCCGVIAAGRGMTIEGEEGQLIRPHRA